MKKYLLFSVSLALIVLMSVSVFGFSLGDLFTGKVIKGDTAPVNEWQDSDKGTGDGNNPFQAGVVYGGDFHPDTCNVNGGITEYFITTTSNCYWDWSRWRQLCNDVPRVNSIVGPPCPNGCENVPLTFRGETFNSVGQCKANIPTVCTDSDSGDNPNIAGMVKTTFSNGAIHYDEDKADGQRIIEYSCNTDKSLKTTFNPCAGTIKSQSVTVSSTTKSASYCDVRPLTCLKTGSTVTAMNANGGRIQFMDGLSGAQAVYRDPTDTCIYDTGVRVAGDRTGWYARSTGTKLRVYACNPAGVYRADYDTNHDNKVTIADANAQITAQVLQTYITQNPQGGDQVIKTDNPCENGCSNGQCVGATCTDTDSTSSDKYAVKGTATARDSSTTYSKEDFCLSRTYLLELSCSSATAIGINAEAKNCGTGKRCNDGACIVSA